MREFFRVVTLAEARQLLREHWPQPIGEEEIDLHSACGRRLSRPVTARGDLPPFSRSTVDGYAVCASSTFGASPSLPAYLELAAEVLMGQVAGMKVGPGQAVLMPTGGMLPAGADAVVMVEHTEEGPMGMVAVLKPVAPGENVIRQGEDVRAAEEIFGAGRLLRPLDLGLLAGCGVTRVMVQLPLVASILATGNEIVPPGKEPAAGQVRDMNSFSLLGLVQAAGGRAWLAGIAPDTLEGLMERVSKALEESDLVLISGGSSVGTRDLLLDVFQQLPDMQLLFHGVALRPGKPALAAVTHSKLLIGLPGHPASAAIFFQAALRPLLTGREGSAVQEQAAVRASLRRSLASSPGREEFIPVRLVNEEGVTWAVPILGKSGLLRPLVASDGLVHIPLEVGGLAAGEEVNVYLWE